jgi:hypothetical protein
MFLNNFGSNHGKIFNGIIEILRILGKISASA